MEPRDVTADFLARHEKGSGALQWLAEQLARPHTHIDSRALVAVLGDAERRLEGVEARLAALDGGPVD